jgi:hypothetical protein
MKKKRETEKDSEKELSEEELDKEMATADGMKIPEPTCSVWIKKE